MHALIRIANALTALELKRAKRTRRVEYRWEDINEALMDLGWEPKRILNLVSELKGKATNGKRNDDAQYDWEDLNEALYRKLRVPPNRILKVLDKLHGKAIAVRDEPKPEPEPKKDDNLNIFDYYPKRKLERTDKDRKRFQDIMNKAMNKGLRGSAYDDEVLRSVERMARTIRHADKAYRRGLAAENENYHDAAKVFFDRAQELLKGMSPM